MKFPGPIFKMSFILFAPLFEMRIYTGYGSSSPAIAGEPCWLDGRHRLTPEGHESLSRLGFADKITTEVEPGKLRRVSISLALP